MKKVLVLYKFLPEYRVDFFNLIRTRAKQHNIQFDVVYGRLLNNDAARKNEADLPWAKFLANKNVKIGPLELLWQPYLKQARKYDLVIAEQANKLLINYMLMGLRKISATKFAFWGHGLNLQSRSSSVVNRFKKMFINQCDWWFAYTDGVKKIVQQNGFPGERITVMQNAIDTQKLVRMYQNTNQQEIEEIRKKYRLNGGPTAIFCGGLYREKQLGFLLAACDRVKKALPQFQLLLVGDGPERHLVSEAAKTRSWLHYVGPRFGGERVAYFKVADVMVMPGLVGLGILDSFAMECPIVTTNYPYHSPEIEYLINGQNGIMTEFEPSVYADTVIALLKNPKQLHHLRNGGREAAGKYSVEQMVNNALEGIGKCLAN